MRSTESGVRVCKPGKRISMASGALLIGTLLATLVSCSDEPECGPEFEEGERFRFTVLGRLESKPTECVPLQVGDDFVLTAGMKQIDRQTCDFRPAEPRVIPQWEGTVDGCGPGGGDLSVNCYLDSGPLGPLTVWTGVPSELRSDMAPLEDGRFFVSWSKPEAGEECEEMFAVRIEALGRAP